MSYLSTTIKRARYLITRDNDHVLILEKNNGSFMDLVLDTADSRDAAITTTVNDLLAGAPDALNTLNELAAAIGDDANFAATVTTALGARLQKSLNLSDLPSASASRTNLGLGSAALHSDTDFDTPTARDTAIATAVTNLINGAPGALNTLNELAAALGNDPSFAATVATALNNRLAWKGAWSATTVYFTNDLVTFNGGLYRAPTNFTSGASFVKANWIELFPQYGAYSVPDVIVSKTANYTANAGEYVLCDTTTAGFTVTLPATPVVGQMVGIKKTSADANVLTISPNVDGGVLTISTQNHSLFVEYDGAAWRVRSGHYPKGTFVSKTGSDGFSVQPDGRVNGQIIIANPTINSIDTGADGSGNFTNVCAILAGGETGFPIRFGPGSQLCFSIGYDNNINCAVRPLMNIMWGAHHQATGAGQVSHGTWGGGSLNVAQADTGTVNSYATMAGGTLHTCYLAGQNLIAPTIGGGYQNTVAGNYATVPGGRNNSALADYSTAMGRQAVAELVGSVVRASGSILTAGDAQVMELQALRQTSDGAAHSLLIDGTTNRIVLADHSSYRVVIEGIARRIDTRSPAQDYSFRFTGIAHRETGVATVVWEPSTSELFDPQATGVVITASADTTNGALSLSATGIAGQTWNWMADVKLVKVSG